VEPPGFLKGNREALAFWRRHVPALVKAGRLLPLHAETFAVVAELASDVRRLTAAIQSEGLLLAGPGGRLSPNPKCRLLRDARRDLLAACRGFGMDSVSDARLPVDPPAATGGTDELEQFLAKHA
jgi:P27 family predicted phage terminase small subunit